MEYISNLDTKNTIKRRLILFALVAITFIFQNTPGFFPAPFGIHAMLLVPLTICISMFEREFAGIFFGLASGAMLDAFSSESLCYHTIILVCIGFISGTLITHIMRNNLVCATILTLLFSFIYNSLYFIIFCAFEGVEKSFLIYLRYYFVSVIYTSIITPIYYIIVRAIEKSYK